MDTHTLTIRSLYDGFRKKEFSAREITEFFFTRIEEKDGEIGAYLSLTKDYAFAAAARADELFEKNMNAPLLAGIPLAVKDNVLLEGTETTAGSKILEHYIASYDATVIRKLKDQHAVFLGKTNLDEFAMGSSTENSAFQITKNPHDFSRVPGGSSGGSAAAVAGALAVASLGSDTGGSIRQPASLCGIVGLKPTYGMVSRYGLIALASSLDQIGPFAKTVEDAAMVYDAIKGHDEHDATSILDEQPETHHHDSDYAKQLTVGIPKEYFIDGIEEEVQKGVYEAIEKFKRLGIRFKEISLPHTKFALSCYYIILPAEVSANLARFDGIRYGNFPSSKAENLKDIYTKSKGMGFGPETKRRVLLGTFVLSAGYYDAYYGKAQKVRQLINNDFAKVFDDTEDGVDVILAPTSPTRAFKIGERASDPLSMYLSDIFTIPANFAGIPALSVPVKQYVVGSGELPVGFQLIGKKMHEKDILALGMYYERN